MKKKLLLLGMGIIAMILVGCGQTLKQSSDNSSYYQNANSSETILARHSIDMSLSSAQNSVSGFSIKGVGTVEDTDQVDVGTFVPDFGDFYVTGNITFNVTAQSWIEADGFLVYGLDYNDVASSYLEKVYVRAYLVGGDGLVGQTNAASVLPVEVKAFSHFGYTELTSTPLTVNVWSVPFAGPVDHMQTLKLRADFTNAINQAYSSKIVFELVRIEGENPPPSSPTAFTATAGDSVVTLNWTNPTDSDFSQVKIVRSTTGYPASYTDGNQVYLDNGTTCTDSGLTNGITYYYSIFARDTGGVLSSAANVIATPKAPVDQNTKLLLHMDDSSFVDETGMNSITNIGVTSVSGPSVWGNSAYLDGASKYLTVPDSSQWNFGTGDFVIDCWIYPSVYKTYNMIWSMDSTDAYFALAGDRLTFYDGSNGFYSPNNSISFNSWQHVAVVRDNGAIKLYINGINLLSDNMNTSIPNGGMEIGKWTGSTPHNFNGYIDEFRISTGTDRGWTGSTITVPTEPY